MNERIKQLAVEAGLLPREIGPVVETRHMKKKEQDIEKFAELIVRECADVGSKFSMAHPEDIRYQIKRHFGVEE
jgi:hypothetical protein